MMMEPEQMMEQPNEDGGQQMMEQPNEGGGEQMM